MATRIGTLPPPRLALWLVAGVLLTLSPWGKATAQISPSGGSKDELEHRQRMAVASAQVQLLQAKLALKRAQMQHEIHELEYQLQVKQAEILRAEAEFRLRQVQAAPDRTEKEAAPESARGNAQKEESRGAADPRSKAVLKKLEEAMAMPFATPTPLGEALKYIKAASAANQDSGIPIYLDPQDLVRAGVTLDSPVRLACDGIPLKTTLGLLLQPLGLGYHVKDGLLVVSTRQIQATDR